MQRFPLCTGPTPLHRLARLGEALGVDLWIKRDDLTGLAFGGNKTRKLEFLVGDALAQGADTLVTSGAAQSNHCRQTAAAAACAGLKCHLALGGDRSAPRDGNLRLDLLLGAHVHWCGTARKGENVARIAEALRADGDSPYVLPYGGSNAIGAHGFAQAVAELHAQTNAPFDAVVFASSSGGTQAGLLAGAATYDVAARWIGVRIDKDPNPDGDLRTTIDALARAITDRPLPALELVEDFLAPGYGVVTALERHALHALARHEGILLDPVYTARAFGGLLAMIEDGRIAPGSRVLFWHTGGGPALFTGDASELL